ncbi:isoamylase [Candidatus Protochlamydia naegleriophila]|uniref:Isoamylase n=1 Tax=Candidatus Protochlamydia naegleriophila TaxID=389348 RepID=A0A0U5ETB2_9BACT|nr:isoamylase [Candidatus Protochlamydia naegleriophila]CUI17440.1 isoamylase [Candidatus Protochlamydia naegleriophila]
MKIAPGQCFPLGATICDGGVNFAIHCKGADTMTLCIYADTEPLKIIDRFVLDPLTNKSGTIWHAFIKDLPDVFGYAYQIKRDSSDSELEPILDPYAKWVLSDPKWHTHSREKLSYRPIGKAFKETFDWGNDKAPNIPKKDLIIYEMHVRGFTAHASSKSKAPGTFKGIIEKIPHLIELGINAVELMPIQEFCEEDVLNSNPRTQQKLHNYFGYSTVNFFSPMNRYASHSSGNKAGQELKALVKELHQNHIEVILDVAFNHTSEGNEKGPAMSFKALDAHAYYLINPENMYLNFSGCGNTFNCNHPNSREFIISVLRHWVTEYHIDGFRFDLASIFNRDRDGSPMENAPIMELLSTDPVLASKKLIAEPWDSGGLYHLGKFASTNMLWSEWNGKFQNVVRHFIKGSPNYKKSFAGALCGTPDIFTSSPHCSINYITCHDGFSLADVVSYNEKHNKENGENNVDGVDHHDTWNCGIEGPSDNKEIVALRNKQMRNFLVALMVSQGIPMLWMGDEYAHSRKGNNNPWCQDNEINWFLWDRLSEQKDFFHFFKKLINFRKTSPLLKQDHFLTDKEVRWHGLEVDNPDWENDNRLLALTLQGADGPELYLAFNASDLSQTVEVPSAGNNRSWRWLINTSLPSPKDFYEIEEKLPSNSIQLAPYSSIILQNQ